VPKPPKPPKQAKTSKTTNHHQKRQNLMEIKVRGRGCPRGGVYQKPAKTPRQAKSTETIKTIKPINGF
jgi:hypothetical protein